MKKLTPFLCTFLLFFSFCLRANTLVGILGDIHEGEESFSKSLNILKEKEVSYIIGTGDFSNGSDDTLLENTLIKLSSLVPQNDIHRIKTVPGNWEFQCGHYESQMLLLEKLTDLISKSYFEAGLVQIKDKKIQVSHHPPVILEEPMLPPLKFRNDSNTGVSSKMGIAPDADLIIFGHTHVSGYQRVGNKLMINPGTLSDRKSNLEPHSMAIYDIEENEIHFIDVDSGKEEIVKF